MCPAILLRLTVLVCLFHVFQSEDADTKSVTKTWLPSKVLKSLVDKYDRPINNIMNEMFQKYGPSREAEQKLEMLLKAINGYIGLEVFVYWGIYSAQIIVEGIEFAMLKTNAAWKLTSPEFQTSWNSFFEDIFHENATRTR